MPTLAYAQTAQAQAAAPQGPAVPQNPIAPFIPLILIFIVFYFLLIRPQRKAQLDHAKMLGGLGKNDEVVTSGGIHGTVLSIQGDVVTLRIDDNVKIKIQKGNIASLKK